MHEYSLVSGLMDALLEASEKERLAKISLVEMRIGKLRSVVPDIFRQAFQTLSEGTLAQGARLEMNFVPGEIICLDCKQQKILDQWNFVCSVCGSGNTELLQGSEILLTKIEGESQDGNQNDEKHSGFQPTKSQTG